jgi:hypothetical protein
VLAELFSLSSTTGDPLNYIKTILEYSLDRGDIGNELRQYFNSRICKK